MRKFKADLAAKEQTQVLDMTARWLKMEIELKSEFYALALDISTKQAAGETITASQLYRSNRYKSLIAQVDGQIKKYGAYSERLISDQQQEVAGLALDHSFEVIKATYASYGMVSGTFDRLPVSAVEFMVGNAGDGSPLNKLLAESYPDAVSGLTDALMRGISLGKSPLKTAADMSNGFGIGLDRALNIARTEELRVYRESSRMFYQNSGVSSGYVRISARDNTVCPACLFADDGTVYSLDVPFEEHPQGRCAMGAVISGLPPLEFETGETWFLKQSESDQIGILGKGKYEAWKENKFELKDIVARRENETWGASLVPKTLGNLLK